MKNTLLLLCYLCITSHLLAQGFALSFDGIDDYGQGLTHLFPSASADDNWTLELWVKTSTSGTLVSQFSAGSSTSGFFDIDGNGKVNYKKGGSSSSPAVVQSTSQIDDGNWHHIAIAKGGAGTNQVRLFIDGVLEDTGTDNTRIFSGINTRVGQLQGGPSGFYFTGEMDELRLWSIALSSTAIANNLSNEFSDPASPSSCLIRYYQMTNGSGINVTSNSGGSVIRLQGGTAWVNSTAPISSQPAPDCAAILPVELLNYKAEALKQSIQLSWQTTTELNNKGFAVEHSTDGQAWKELAFVSGAGTSHQLQTYDYQHLSPRLGMNYYRLKQVDEDGYFVYFDKTAIDFHVTEQSIQVFPNPFSQSATIRYFIPKYVQQAAVQISDIYGTIIKVIPVNARDEGQVMLEAQALSAGAYFYTLVLDGQILESKQMILMK